MTLFTMPRMGLEHNIRTIEKDNRSRVPMGFHQLTRSSIRYRGFTLIDLLGAPAETEASHWFVNHWRLTAVPLCATFSAPSTSNASSRLLQIMSFAENSGMIDSVHRTRELYGRGTQSNLAAERNGVHSDKFMD